MNNKELEIASNTVLGIDFAVAEERVLQDETHYICEGEEDKLKLMKLLQDKTITGRDRQRAKFLNFPHLYENPSEGLSMYAKGAAGGKSILSLHTPKKRCSEDKTMVFRMMYGGICYKYLPTKIKKGAGKGKTRMQKVKINSQNFIDNYYKSL